MAGIHGTDVTDVQVMQRHKQLSAQCAVVHIPGSQEQCAQELQHHVIELHILPNHVCQLLHHLGARQAH